MKLKKISYSFFSNIATTARNNYSYYFSNFNIKQNDGTSDYPSAQVLHRRKKNKLKSYIINVHVNYLGALKLFVSF